MAKVIIHKEGEHSTIESPDMPVPVAEHQCEEVEKVISVRHREGGVEQDRDVSLNFVWCQIAAHVITGVEIVDSPVGVAI